ncbi:MAG: DUF2071 domain-containing protein [Planctomycetota bacterium]
MRLPRLSGTIERRILLNFRIRPEFVARLLPAPFAPVTVRDWAIGGICLIRLARVRPALVPGFMGMRSENCAHRFAVQWREGATTRRGVYITRRDSNQWLNAVAGGRLFPGVQHWARFQVDETSSSWAVRVESTNPPMQVAVAVHLCPTLNQDSVFSSLSEASSFFRASADGYSPSHAPGRFDGMHLQCDDWNVEALRVERAESTFFEDPHYFPRGSVQLDCALLMRDLRHQWLGLADVCCDSECPDTVGLLPGHA